MTLTKYKNNKTPGDLLNMELFKYATLKFKTRLLTFFDGILHGESPQKAETKQL
jgi:hypothetical protein